MADGDQTHSSSFADSDVSVRRPLSILRRLAFWKNQKRPPEREIPRIIQPNASLPANISKKHHPHKGYKNNKIRTTKYTLLTFVPKNLFEQFHRFANLYFIFIVLLNWIPWINAFGKEIAIIPVVFVLVVTAIKDWFEDIRRYKSDKRLNNLTCRVYSRDAERYVKKLWKEVCVGDFVHLSCNEVIPADILLLHCSDEQGLCYIETANIDGESNLKQREVARGLLHQSQQFSPLLYQCKIECDPPNHKIYRFNGCIVYPTGERVPISRENLLLRDCVLKNADFAEGIVVYAGHETKTMLNNGGPRYKRSKLEKLMNRDVIFCVFILLLLCFLGALGNGLFLNSFESIKDVPFLNFFKDNLNSIPEQSFLVFWTFVIVLQVMIPLSLYVTIEIIKLGQVYFIHQDCNLYDPTSNKKLECRAFNITEELGQVEYIFSDKTGTLTDNNMVFRRCTICGVDYNHQSPKATNGDNQERFYDKPGDTPHNKLDCVIPNPNLEAELSQMEIQFHMSRSETEIVHLSRNSQRIQDFFLLLAVCNTVVVSKYPHKDQMNSSGLCLNVSTPTIFRLRGNTELWDCTDEKNAHLLSYTNTPQSSAASTPIRRPHSLAVPNAAFFPGSVSPSPTELRPIYEAESPDEIALVNAAFAYNCRLLRRTPDFVLVSLPGEGLIEFKVLHVLPFDSTRKRMSIILEHPISGEKILYCKGADSTILSQLAPTKSDATKDMILKTQQQLNNYSRKGLRVLCMAKKVLTPGEYLNWLEEHQKAECSFGDRDREIYKSACKIETNLELLGATGIEDKLQDGVPKAIAALRKAGITVWVLTGDKQETAVNIAYSCKLFTTNMEIITLNARSKETAEETMKFYLSQIRRDVTTENYFSPQNAPISTDMHNYLRSLIFYRRRDTIFDMCQRKKPRALVIDGRTLAFVLDPSLAPLFIDLSQYCTSVLCCRATPLQKAYVVRLIKDNLKVKTLAIGDGANDVSMIQVADVGIGISGKEGMQAVMASDFALSRFQYLERLLLVHGHWCYERLAKIVLYFFYKNAYFIFVVCWYQWSCGFSATVMVDDLYLMLFNVLFISLPPIVMGILDKDCPEDLLLFYPHLYAQGQNSEVHTKYSFWFNMLDAVYQSIVTFFVPLLAYYDSDVGISEFGTTICTACILVQLLHLSIETKSWTYLHVLSIIISLVIYFGFAIVYNTWTTVSVTFYQGPYWVIIHAMETAVFWFCIALIPILSCLPRLTLRALQGSLFPSCVSAVLCQEKKNRKNASTVSVSWSKASSEDSAVEIRNENSENQSNDSSINGAPFQYETLHVP